MKGRSNPWSPLALSALFKARNKVGTFCPEDDILWPHVIHFNDDNIYIKRLLMGTESGSALPGSTCAKDVVFPEQTIKTIEHKNHRFILIVKRWDMILREAPGGICPDKTVSCQTPHCLSEESQIKLLFKAGWLSSLNILRRIKPLVLSLHVKCITFPMKPASL